MNKIFKFFTLVILTIAYYSSSNILLANGFLQVSVNCSELEPSNPYSTGTGHYAGYEWAESRNAIFCGGNSNSFIEGCEEYLRQIEEFESCETES